MASYPQFLDSILFRAVRGAILDILNKFNRADFFWIAMRGKTPQKIAHVKLQILMLEAELKLHMPFSQLRFHILASRATRKNYEQSWSGRFYPPTLLNIILSNRSSADAMELLSEMSFTTLVGTHAAAAMGTQVLNETSWSFLVLAVTASMCLMSEPIPVNLNFTRLEFEGKMFANLS